MRSWILRAMGHIAIDRKNKESAVKSLDKAVQKIHRWNRSISISPVLAVDPRTTAMRMIFVQEGTRSTSGRVLDFKKGPFHVARKVGLPITPLVLLGAYELW